MQASSIAHRWVAFADRHRRALLSFGTLLALAGGLGTAALYSDLRPDMTELLPKGTRTAIDTAAVAARTGGMAEDTMVLHGADKATMERFADALAAKLSAHPDLIREVEYRIDDVARFYHSRRWLFPSPKELVKLKKRIKARLAWERQHANPMMINLDDQPPPSFDDIIKEVKKKHDDDLLTRFPDGYFVAKVPSKTPGKKMLALVVLARMSGSPSDYAQVAQVNRLVHRTVAELNPHSYAKGLEVGYCGYVASAVLEHDALAQDLIVATLLVLLAVALVIIIYYRSWKALPLIGVPLLTGTLITFGIADLAVGHLNSNTAFLGSIVIGNGINVSLILFARYLEERRLGHAALQAMQTAVATTWLPTVTASLAAGVSYASLMATNFRGFNQFGLIGGVGMASCWVASFAILPPLALAWERWRSLLPAHAKPTRPLFMWSLANLADKWRGPVLAAVVLACAAAGWSTARFLRDPVEYDFSKLRDIRADNVGEPGWWDQRVDALFGRHLTPSIYLAHNSGEARIIAARLEEEKAANPNTTIGTISSIASFVPSHQAAKIPIIRQIRALATPTVLKSIPLKKRRRIEAALPPANLVPFTAADLPATVKRQLTERDGRFGTPVLVYPADSVSTWSGRDALAVESELRSIPLPSKGIPLAGPMLVMADVMHAMAGDGPRATLLSFFGVVLFVLFGFLGLDRRAANLRGALLVLGSLLIGVLWFVGLAGVLDMKLNMLNFIALPITFGIGVDYATNVVQRWRVDNGRPIGEILRTTGGAVALCSLTTIIGYSSLLVARNQALVSFGLLADLGEAACLSATLLALPAVTVLRQARRHEAISS